MLLFQGNKGKDLIVLTNLIVYYVEYHLILIIFFIDVNNNVRSMIIVHTLRWSKRLSIILEFLLGLEHLLSLGQVLVLK